MSRRRDRKRPTSSSPGPHAKDEDAENERDQPKQDHLDIGGGKHEDPSGKRHEAGQRIEPHAIRARTLSSAPAQHRQRPNLPDELNQNSRGDERVDDQAKREEAAYD